MGIFSIRNRPTIRLPQCLRGVEGVFAAPCMSIGLDDSYKGTVLCVQDNKKNIQDLSKIKDMFLQVKSGVVKTDYGIIMFILFIFYKVSNPNDKFTYEVLLNPNEMESVSQYGILALQKKWNVFVVDNNKVLNIYEFDNVYNLGSDLEQAVKVSKNNRCTDFNNAKKYYFQEYDIDTLLNL